MQLRRAAGEDHLQQVPDAVGRRRAPREEHVHLDEMVQGRDAIVAFLKRKWARELDYRLVKELWGFRENRMAVRFKYEWHDDCGNWFRAHGNELWEFDDRGLMRRREASINDAPILEGERQFVWSLGPRPTDYPGLTEMGL